MTILISIDECKVLLETLNKAYRKVTVDVVFFSPSKTDLSLTQWDKIPQEIIDGLRACGGTVTYTVHNGEETFKPVLVHIKKENNEAFTVDEFLRNIILLKIPNDGQVSITITRNGKEEKTYFQPNECVDHMNKPHAHFLQEIAKLRLYGGAVQYRIMGEGRKKVGKAIQAYVLPD